MTRYTTIRDLAQDIYAHIIEPDGLGIRDAGTDIFKVAREVLERLDVTLADVNRDEALTLAAQIIDGEEDDEDEDEDDGITVSRESVSLDMPNVGLMNINEEVLSHYEITRLLELLGIVTCEDDADSAIYVGGRRCGIITGDTVGVIRWEIDPDEEDDDAEHANACTDGQ